MPNGAEKWTKAPKKRILEDVTQKKGQSRPERVWCPHIWICSLYLKEPCDELQEFRQGVKTFEIRFSYFDIFMLNAAWKLFWERITGLTAEPSYKVPVVICVCNVLAWGGQKGKDRRCQMNIRKPIWCIWVFQNDSKVFRVRSWLK